MPRAAGLQSEFLAAAGGEFVARAPLAQRAQAESRRARARAAAGSYSAPTAEQAEIKKVGATGSGAARGSSLRSPGAHALRSWPRRIAAPPTRFGRCCGRPQRAPTPNPSPPA